NTAAAKVIEQEGLDLDASLRLAIATEVALGSRSRWHGYFMSFTRPFEDLPYLWSPEQRRQLAGTDAEGTVEETLAELELEYAEAAVVGHSTAPAPPSIERRMVLSCRVRR
ncbi:ABCF5, partial [Symbiodinium sp. KB8]